MKLFFGFVLLVLSACCSAQQKRYIEELAFYHLTNLQDLDPALKDVRYFTTGHLRGDTTGYLDTLLLKPGDTLFVPNPFPDAQVEEKKDLAQFEVPAYLRGRKNAYPLQIKHYLRASDRYYVHFSCLLNEYEGVLMLVSLDLKGNLARYKIVPFTK